MLQGYTMATVPCGNPTPKKLPTGGGEWPTSKAAAAIEKLPMPGGGARTSLLLTKKNTTLYRPSKPPWHQPLPARYRKPPQISSQRLLDQSQGGVYRGKRHIPPHFGLFGAVRVPYPKGLNC